MRSTYTWTNIVFPAATSTTHTCNRSLVNYNLHDYDAALSDAEESLVLDPEWMKGFHRRGLALLALNRNKEAQSVYEEALKLQPRNKVIKSCLKKVLCRFLLFFVMLAPPTCCVLLIYCLYFVQAKKAIANAAVGAAAAAASTSNTSAPVKVHSREEFLTQYDAQTDTKVRMATLVTFWNSSTPFERLEFVKRLIKIIGGSTYELQIQKLSAEHMAKLPNKNYTHIKIPPHWIEFFLAQTASDKVVFMENVWIKSTPGEQNLIIQDLQHFFGDKITSE